MNTLYDTMSPEETRKLYKQMIKEQLAAKYTLPTKPSSDGYYHLWIKDDKGRRQIKAKTLDGLKEKLYDRNTHTFKSVFIITQTEKTKYIKDPEKLLSVQNTMWRTQKNYERYFDGTDFENMPVEEMTVEDIDNVCYLNLNRYDLKEKAFLSMRGIIKGVIEYSLSKYWIADNTYARVDFKKYTFMIVRPVDIEERIHTENELDMMFKYIDEKLLARPNVLTPLALKLQICAGLRRGEIPPLTWDDVSNGYIFIRREQITLKKRQKGDMERDAIVSHTKTWKNRKFPITAEIQEILDRIREIDERKYPDSPYLFPKRTDPSKPISNHAVYQFYFRMCQTLGIETSKDVIKGPHSFRRNAITKAVNNANGNVYMASKLFGNTPGVINKNYYAGLDLDEAKALLE